MSAGRPGTMTTGLQALRGHHHDIIRMHSLGATNEQIAAHTGVTTATVSNVLRSLPAREVMDGIRADTAMKTIDVVKQIKDMVPRALQVMEEIMDNEDVSAAVRLRAATDLMDRAGHGAVKKVDMRSTSVSLTQDDLEKIKRRAMELNPNVVDVDSTVR